MDIDELAEKIVESIKEHHHAFWIDPETHSEQHQFIAEMIQERKDRQARRARIEEKVAGSVVLSALIFILGLLGAGAIQWIREHLK